MRPTFRTALVTAAIGALIALTACSPDRNTEACEDFHDTLTSFNYATSGTLTSTTPQSKAALTVVLGEFRQQATDLAAIEADGALGEHLDDAVRSLKRWIRIQEKLLDGEELDVSAEQARYLAAIGKATAVCEKTR